MLKIILSIIFTAAHYQSSFSAEFFRQEHAKVLYYNSKYITDVVVFTGRQRRGEPYLTNATGVIQQPWGDNITIVVNVKIRNSEPIEFRFKLCEFMKVDWMVAFVQTYSDIKLVCPLPAKRYSYYNIELPPKNLPFLLLKGDYTFSVTFYVSNTNEKVLEFMERLHPLK